MSEAYHDIEGGPRRDGGSDEADDPRLAIRRHTDRCFFRVEEVVPGTMGGYIVEGMLVLFDDVAEVVRLDAAGAPLPRCVGDTCDDG